MSAAVLVHFGLCVSDIARAERFYTEAFGYVRDRELRLSAAQVQPLLQLERPSDLHAVYLLLGGQTLELLALDPAPHPDAARRTFAETGLTHLSIAVDDVAATCAKAAQLGGTVLISLGRAAMLRDPDGQLIELLQSEVQREIEQGRADRAAKE